MKKCRNSIELSHSLLACSVFSFFILLMLLFSYHAFFLHIIAASATEFTSDAWNAVLLFEIQPHKNFGHSIWSVLFKCKAYNVGYILFKVSKKTSLWPFHFNFSIQNPLIIFFFGSVTLLFIWQTAWLTSQERRTHNNAAYIHWSFLFTNPLCRHNRDYIIFFVEWINEAAGNSLILGNVMIGNIYIQF